MKSNFIFIILLFLISCEKKDASIQPLLNTQWFLTSIQNTKTNEITKFPDNLNPREYIIFKDPLNTLTVSGICNGCGGTYSLNNDLISTSGLACTQIYCSQWEDYLFYNLDSIFRYEIKNDQLTIYSKGTYNLNFVSK